MKLNLVIVALASELVLVTCSSFAQSPPVIKDGELVEIDRALAVRPDDFDLQFKKAHRLGVLRRYREELPIAQALVGKFPNRRNAHYTLMQAQQGLENYSASLEALNRMMRIEAHESDFVMRSNLLAHLGRYEDALADATRAMKSFPENKSLYLVRARCLYRLKGPNKQTIIDLEKVLKMDPSDSEIANLLIKIRAAETPSQTKL